MMRPKLTPVSHPARPSWIRRFVLPLARFLLGGVVLAWLYGWSAPLIYRQKGEAGFWLGCAHGALMPMAMPSLLLHQDVPIYAQVNQGRNYKLGYIAGIDACGFVVFGALFWKPNRRGKGG